MEVLASVLLHCQNPAGIIAECAKRSNAIVITELFHADLSGPVCELVPSRDNEVWHTWWRFTPEFFANYLGMLGFGDIKVSRHEHRHTLVTDRLYAMFSVVGTRL